MITLVTPAIAGGVLDFTRLLAARLEGHVLLWDGAAVAGPTMPLPAGPGGRPLILIQFSSYGFQKRGVPLALLAWARAQQRRGARIGVFFHELYAFGPPWTSSFWLSPAQRRVAAELARLADYWLTSRQASADWLLRAAGAKPHAVLPVFSNVGEAERFEAARQPTLVVFGSAELRRQTYLRAGPSLLAAARRRGLCVLDIGPGISDPALAEVLRRAGVEVLGPLEAAAVSNHLGAARFGAVAYPVTFAAKSGVLAAYCAHGVAPILLSDVDGPADGLNEGAEFMRWRDGTELPERACAIGRRAFAWYQGHRLGRHADVVRGLAGLMPEPAQPGRARVESRGA